MTAYNYPGELPAGVKQCKTQAEVRTHANMWALGVGAYGRIQNAPAFSQYPETGSFACVSDNIDTLVAMFINTGKPYAFPRDGESGPVADAFQRTGKMLIPYDAGTSGIRARVMPLGTPAGTVLPSSRGRRMVTPIPVPKSATEQLVMIRAEAEALAAKQAEIASREADVIAKAKGEATEMVAKAKADLEAANATLASLTPVETPRVQERVISVPASERVGGSNGKKEKEEQHKAG